jgi:hypothetical protein
MDLEKSLLEDIIRTRGVTHQTGQKTQKLGLVALDQRAHGRGIP